MKKMIVSFLFGLTTLASQAQQNSIKKPAPELVKFFAGEWQGEGQFSNGKPIAAELLFKASLDSTWLEHTHLDKAPNTYKATSWWGLDQQSGDFIAYIFDNFGGHRKFTSSGWSNGKFILTAQQTNANGVLIWQHFIYEKLTDLSFKMTYEVSKDGSNWRMIDYLVFKRKVA